MNHKHHTINSSRGNLLADVPSDISLNGLTIEEKIGEGAMANLYLARNEDGDPRVVKIPCRSLKVDPVCLVAFENELRLAEYLGDFGSAYMPQVSGQDSNQYLVMDYIEGMDLWSYLKQHGPLPEARVLALGKKIVRAVAELHERRIVHLDLKLSNVMLTPEGEVRLIDFGLANHLDLPDLIHESFREPKGTPAYIAPEQFIGVRDELRSDLFSVGVMLFELATGELPFPNASSMLGVISRIKRTPVSPRLYKPELSQQFASVIEKCLQANPDHRFINMEALHDVLEAWESGLASSGGTSPVSAAVTNTAGRFSAWPRTAAAYLGGIFNRADHFGQLHRWVDKRRRKHTSSVYRILAAIDLTAGSDLNVEILRQAQQLASLQPSLITVMHVTSVDIGMASGEKKAEIVNEHLVSKRKEIADLLSQTGLATALAGINVVIGSDPVSAIEQCVKDYRVDMVVIGCKPRKPLAKFIHGKTGYRILTSVKRNVFVVHAQAQARGEPAQPAIGNVA